MQFNLSHKSAKLKAFQQLGYYAEKGFIIDLKKVENTRTNLQNRALHLYFKHVADALLEVGYDYIYINPIDGDFIYIPFTGDLVKNYIWRPLQEKMFEIESTTKLTTKMIDEILTVLSLWLGEKNKSVTFPCEFDLLVKRMNENDVF